MNKKLIIGISIGLLAVAIYSVIKFTGNSGQKNNIVPTQNKISGDVYYGLVGIRQKLSSGRDNDYLIIAKFNSNVLCEKWLATRKDSIGLQELNCEKLNATNITFEDMFSLIPVGRTYLSFTDLSGVSARVMPLSGSREDSTLIALILKKQLENMGITNIKVVYYVYYD